MKRYFPIYILIVLSSCTTQDSLKDNISKNGKDQIIQHSVKKLAVTDLIDLFEHIKNNHFIETKLDSFGIHEKNRVNGVYISDSTVMIGKPLHWVSIFEAGSLSTISLKTADSTLWNNIKLEVGTLSKGKKVNDTTGDEIFEYRYKSYTITSIKPKDGLNIPLNNLYEFILMKNK